MGFIGRPVVTSLLFLFAAIGAGCAGDLPAPTPTGQRSPPPTLAPGPTSGSPTGAPTPAGATPLAPTVPPMVSPTAPVNAPSPPTEYDWRAAPRGSDFSDFDVIHDATAVGPALIAVGSYDDGSSLGGAAAWVSRDGLGWQRAARVPAAETAVMAAVTAGPDGFVTVGYREEAGTVVPAVWISADGREWQFVNDDDLDRGQMTAVAVNGGRYVALGFDPETEEGLAWGSRDGRDWSAAMPVPAFELQPSVNDVAALGEGFVAYGFTTRDERAALWLSLDGREWQPVLGLSTSPNSSVNAVVSSGPRLVAVGASYLAQGTVALAWVSDDGLDWQRTLDHEAGERGEMLAVVAVGSGFLAVGDDGGEERGDFSAAAWWSDDGTSWERLPNDPSFARGRMSHVLRVGAGLVVLGERALDPAAELFRPAVWLASPR